MKKMIKIITINLLLSYLLLGCGFTSLTAQDTYEDKMMELKLRAEAAEKKEEFRKFKNEFSSIAASKNEEWLPRYYEAFCTMAWAFEEKDNDLKAKLVEQFELMINTLEAKIGEHEELEVLKVRLLQLKIGLPNADYATLGLGLYEKIGNLVAQYPNNPRVLLVAGQTIYFSPDNFMGYSKKQGLDYIKKAATILEKVDYTKTIEPSWGYIQAYNLLKKTNQNKTNENSTTLSNKKENILAIFDGQKKGSNYEKIIEELDQLIENDPSNPLWQYYKAFSFIQLALQTEEIATIDTYCDKAEKILLTLPAGILPIDEILCLQAMEKAARIRVDYNKRGLKYYGASEQLLDFALAINPNNPRVYFLKGQNKLHCPEKLGGGKTAAQKYFIKSKKLFDNIIPPNKETIQWGQNQINQIVANL